MTTQASNPSTINEEKVGRFLDLLRPEVRGLGISEADFQKHFIEGEKELRIKSRFRELLQQIVAEATNTIVVVAKRVDYTRTPQQAIHATRRAEYLTDSVVATMPRRVQGVVENLPVVFFKPGRSLTVEELEREYETRGLTPDPYAQSAVNEQDAAFGDEHPNGTQWDREDKVASFLAFDRWHGERSVYCDRGGSYWDGGWWFAGVRKS